MMGSPAIQIVENWRNVGIARAASTPMALARAERELQVKFPAALSELLLAADGMQPNVADEDHFRFLSLDEIRPVAAEFPDLDPVEYRDLVVCVEYCLWAHAYAVRLDSTGLSDAVVLVGGTRPLPIANGFSEFLSLYLLKSNLLFGT
jgi:hypothetical protein